MADLLVTILMPAYNASATIAESIVSVQRQTYQSWILLILDDGSSDATESTVSPFLSDERVRYLKLPHSGFSQTLNYGLRIAETEWIARIDSDDLWKPERLTRQMEFLTDHPSAKVVGTWAERINDRGEHICRMDLGPATVKDYEKRRDERTPFYLSHSSILARRQILIDYGGYRESEYPLDDTFLWTRIAKDHLVLSVPLNLTSYRISSNGISSRGFFRMSLQKERLAWQVKTGREISVEEYESHIRAAITRYLDFLRRAYASFWFRQGAAFLLNGRGLRGSVFLLGSLCLSPMHLIHRAVSRT